ncbi:MAG: 3-deoxy-D-manno-octulosonic acid transferase [Aquificae bacterium]|nr:3-deoxy-D-manno-octulosonic acid transferase [Aquificota bacterium]
MRIIYDFLYGIFLLLALPFFIFSSKKKGYSPDLKERFVLYREREENLLWFHCASVGELNLAKPLIDHFGRERKILITVSSPRGKDYAKKLYPQAKVRTVPFDVSFLIKRFLKLHRPDALVVVEGELWFNLITLSGRKIPAVSVNARISPSSYRIYKRLKFFYKKIFSAFRLVLARSETDYRHIREFLDDGSRLKLCGDLKFVSSRPSKQVEFYGDGRFIVAGSTHSPEEELMLRIFKRLKEKHPDLKLILAPRHVERIGEVERLVNKEGLTYTLRSRSKKAEGDVYLIDTVGELAGFYRHGDGIFIGGTVAEVGGHNVLEAVLQGKRVVVGKNYHKIKDTVEELSEEGAVVVAEGERELEKALEESLTEKGKATGFEKKAEKIFNCYVENLKKVLEWQKA